MCVCARYIQGKRDFKNHLFIYQTAQNHTMGYNRTVWNLKGALCNLFTALFSATIKTTETKNDHQDFDSYNYKNHVE